MRRLFLRRKPLRVRTPHERRTKLSRFLYGVLRFGLFGAGGLAGEVGFYNLVRLGRRVPLLRELFLFQWGVDPKLDLNAIWETPWYVFYGQCSLWMFPVYAGAAWLIGVVYDRGFCRVHVLWRALAYGLWILLWEWATGWVLFGLTGFRIWYYADPAAIQQMTSLYILPIWMVTGLMVERIHRELMDPRVAQGLEAALPG